ncbi:alcohol dehydrogenase [Dacryopinax primogenitus]|uniref:Alcohol dehydrogenase n=1 Tax=Dacryopinax primogenitus (strain DJM 731) TaxID=1858805 RepID=M5G748_DACPD|nr:alcohol dehydrogenase [Dacryopinax primogenitus]EJU01637.1 alcohol dehydrogenase [Dacryopinax primogenitus]
MAPTSNARIVLSSFVTGYPVPGKDITLDTTGKLDPDVVELNGGFLTKTLYLSLDPYQRGRMAGPTVHRYSSQWNLGDTLDNHGIAVVVRSEVPALPAGTYIQAWLPWEAYTVHPASTASLVRVIEKRENVPLSTYLDVLGMPGETGWYGLEEYGELKAVSFSAPHKEDLNERLSWQGESIYVSTGAGPVGSMVIQLAKAKGLRVIASTGSAEKLAFLSELGVDRAFNYKTTSVADELREFGGIDVYWDNVGGKMRLNLDELIYRSIKMIGFVVNRLRSKYQSDFYATAPGMVARGELKYQEDVTEGWEAVGEAFVRLMKGQNVGKAIVRVAEE